MCKEGCCVRLGQEGVVWGLGEVFENLKRGLKKKKKVRGKKDFRKGSQTGWRGRCLKKGGRMEPPYKLRVFWG